MFDMCLQNVAKNTFVECGCGTQSLIYLYVTVVSEYLALQVVGPKDMKKQEVVGPAKMVSAITRLGKVRLT